MTLAMMMTVLLVALLPFAGRSWDLYLSVALLLATVLYSRPLWHAVWTQYTGIAPFRPRVDTYTVIVVVFGLCCLLLRRRLPRAAATFAPFLVFTTIAMVFLWPGESFQWAGWQSFVLGFVAVACGAHAGRAVTLDPDRAHAFLRVVTALVLVELLVSVLQLAGYHLFPVDVHSAQFVVGRANGTTDHPNTLGKFMQLLLICALPQTRSPQLRTRHLAALFVILALLTTVLTGGRAVTLGVVVTVTLWYALFYRTQALSRRVTVPLAALACSLPFLGSVVARFKESGGSRTRLSEVATHFVIPDHLWLGVGPNSYLHYVSLHNLNFGSDLPVHDSFLLSLAELGVPLFALLWGGVLLSLLLAWRRRSVEGLAGDGARALIAGVPGLLVIALTGWGLIAGGVFVVFMFTIGFCLPERRDTGSMSSAGRRRPAARTAAQPGRTPVPAFRVTSEPATPTPQRREASA